MARSWRRVDLVYWQTRQNPEPPCKPIGCNPVQFVQPDAMEAAEVAPERRSRCVRHSECLSYAAELSWIGMSCGKCTVDMEYRQGSDRDRDDYIGIAELFAAAAGNRLRRANRVARNVVSVSVDFVARRGVT